MVGLARCGERGVLPPTSLILQDVLQRTVPVLFRNLLSICRDAVLPVPLFEGERRNYLPLLSLCTLPRYARHGGKFGGHLKQAMLASSKTGWRRRWAAWRLGDGGLPRAASLLAACASELPAQHGAYCSALCRAAG